MVTTARLRAGHLTGLDGLVGLAIVIVAGYRTPGAAALGWALGAALGTPLVVRRRFPVPVLAAVVVAAAVAIAVGTAGEAAIYAIAFAVYPVGVSTSARAGAAALGGALIGVGAAALAVLAVPGLPVVAPAEAEESFATSPATALLFSAVIIVGSWTLARVVRARRRQAALLAELRAREAATEERLRIARDVHDAVGHSLSVIAMQAAVANHLADSHPGAGRDALGTIERISRHALDDVRAVLGAMRDLAESAPGGQQLDRLVQDTRAAGIAVEVDKAELTHVPVAVQASAYRIVQEALTNVLRHADATRCLVAVAVEPGALAVSVIDDGTARDAAGPAGHGLLGMRERAALHDGTLEAGPAADGGFAVLARLPFRSLLTQDAAGRAERDHDE